MGVYDPLGLVSPALLHGKLLLRRLYAPSVKGGWDADLPREEKIRWASWFRDLLVPCEATFPRSTKPANAVGLPRLVGFGDASNVALCVVLYVVWTDASGRHHPRVLTGRCRVAPLLGSTIPRGELQAIVMLHRLVSVIVDAFPFQFDSIATYSDSLCSIGAMYKSTSSLRPYFANRVLEVLRLRELLQEKTRDLAPISHIPGDLNPADLGTRGSVSVGDLGPGSTWQVGPKFLLEDYDKWPRTSSAEASKTDVPPEEARVMFGRGSQPSPSCAVVTMLKAASGQSKLGDTISQMSNQVMKREKLEMLSRSFARVLRAVLSGCRDDCRKEPSVKMVQVAVQVLLRVASKSAVAAA